MNTIGQNIWNIVVKSYDFYLTMYPFYPSYHHSQALIIFGLFRQTHKKSRDTRENIKNFLHLSEKAELAMVEFSNNKEMKKLLYKDIIFLLDTFLGSSSA